MSDQPWARLRGREISHGYFKRIVAYAARRNGRWRAGKLSKESVEGDALRICVRKRQENRQRVEPGCIHRRQKTGAQCSIKRSGAKYAPEPGVWHWQAVPHSHTLSVRSLVTGNAYRLALLAPAAARWSSEGDTATDELIKYPFSPRRLSDQVGYGGGKPEYGLFRKEYW